MSLRLQSISQLSSVQYDNEKQSIAEKYAALVTADTAYIEVSYKPTADSDISSLKLDFKRLVSDIATAIADLSTGVGTGFVTRNELNTVLNNYVTIGTEQTIVGKKTFSAPTTTFNAISSTDITATGTAALTAEHAKWS